MAERMRQEKWEMVLLPELRADEEGVVWLVEDEESFLGGCLRAAEAGALGDLPDASKCHQGPQGLYTRHSKECRDDMPRGTTECPRCSRPGDLLKQQGGNSTLRFPPAGLRDGAEMGLTVLGIGGVWRLGLGRGWRQWKRTQDRGGGERREGRGRVGALQGAGFGGEGGCDGIDAHDDGQVESAEGLVKGTEQG